MSEVIVTDKVAEHTQIVLDNLLDERVKTIKMDDAYNLEHKYIGVRSSQVTALVEILIASGIINVDIEHKTINITEVMPYKRTKMFESDS